MTNSILTSAYIVKYQYGGNTLTEPRSMSDQLPTREHVALIQRERERTITNDRLARLAACSRACCNPTVFDRRRAAPLRGADSADC